MTITPDQIEYWRYGFLTINNTLVTTWVLILFLVGGSWLITRKFSADKPVDGKQGVLEMIVITISDQIEEAGLQTPLRYLPFLGTLFLFIVTANLATIFPGYKPPTSSLSTTAALAICVFLAVPLFNIYKMGLCSYLKTYISPNPLLAPFNIIGEFTRTISLAFRLFGNMMSGEIIISILLTLTPFFFPVVMNLFGLLTGVIQAYIFTILATVYIAAASKNT